MPIYEYVCPKCGNLISVLQSMNDPAPTCTKCQTGPMRKQISTCGFQLKGTGWYATDFKDNKEKPNVSASDQTETKKKPTENQPEQKKTKSTDKSVNSEMA